jgi:hypothetical protein
LQGLDEAFDFAVPSRRVGRDADVLDLVAFEQFAQAAAVAVDHRVVGHQRFGWIEAELAEEGEGAAKCAQVRLGVFAWVELDIGEARVVVDDAVQVVVADSAVALRF